MTGKKQTVHEKGDVRMKIILFIYFMTYFDVVTHELGHYAAMKWTGIRAEEVCFGKGPQLYAWRRGKTLFTLRLLPNSGYTLYPDGHAFSRASVPDKILEDRLFWLEILIDSAGCAMNAACALVLGLTQIFVDYGSLSRYVLSAVVLFGGTAIENLIPIGRRDGARILRLVSKRIRRKRRLRAFLRERYFSR